MIAASLALLASAPAQVLRLVQDIDPRAAVRSHPGEPGGLVRAGGKVFFVMQTAELGHELWVSDGTKAGTQLVRDIRLGNRGSFPRDFAALGARVFFTADDGAHGREVWVSDGTAAGTKMVGDLRPGPLASAPRDLHAFSNRVAFVADDGVNGVEFFTTRGGRPEIHEVRRGPAHMDPRDVTFVGNRILFSGDDGRTGREPWRFSSSGFRPLADVAPGPASSSPRDFGPDPANDFGIVFTADLPQRGRELMIFRNGTLRMARDLRPNGSSSPAGFVRAGKKTFFTADDGKVGRELYVVTSSSVQLLKDIRAGSASPGIRDMVALGDKLLFSADDGVHGRELWTSDGTASGTKLVVDLFPGSAGSQARGLRVLGSRVFFSAGPPGVGRELVVSDGTGAGTRLFVDLNAGGNGDPREIVGDDKRLFCVADLVLSGDQIVSIDLATAKVTHPRLLRPRTFSSNPKEIFAIPGTSSILFQAFTQRGLGLFRSDGTPSGTLLLKAISPSSFVLVDDRICFVANQQIHETDGTSSGTRRLLQSDLRIGEIHACGKKLFFGGNDFKTGSEPYSYDPASDRLESLGDLVTGRGSSLPAQFVDTDSGCFFVANVDRDGRQLFVSDGTATGTRIVNKMPNAGVDHVTKFSDRQVLFVANQGGQRRLFISDGTVVGTRLILAAGNPVLDATRLTVLPGQRKPIAFGVARFGRRRAVFATTGATATIRGSLINADDQDPSSLTAAGDRIFFSAIDDEFGREWFAAKANGELRFLGDQAKGPAASALVAAETSPLGAGSEALLALDDGISGQELWISSGSSKTTRLLVDAVPGAEGLRPENLTRAGALVFFTGDDGATGRELYVLDQRPLGASLAVKFGKKCRIVGKKAPEVGRRGVPELGSIGFAVVAKSRAKNKPVALFFGAQRIALSVGPCQLSVVTLFTLLGATGGDGIAEIPIVIPNDTNLLGTTFRTQFAVVDNGGSIGGVFDLSDAIEIVVGKQSS